MARARLLALALLIAASAAVGEQTRTFRMTATQAECFGDFATGGNCFYRSADGSGSLVRYFTMCGFHFADPLPVGSIVYEVDVRSSVIGIAGYVVPITIYLNAPGYLPEYEIGTTAAPAYEPTQCDMTGIAGDFRLMPTTTIRFPTGYGFYNSGGINTIVAQPAYIAEFIDVTLHYDPPPQIDFDIVPGTVAPDRRVLIHRWRDEPQYPYTSMYQDRLPGTNADRDRRIEIAGTVSSGAGAAMPNETVYLRVVDPPDDAPYVPAVERVRGDNAAFLGGVLDAVIVTTDSGGRFRTILTGSEVAGDNYEIQASTLPNFGFSSACDATNNCYRSGVITMWKRVYVEHDRMFRRGAYLTADVPPCSLGPCFLPLDEVRDIHRRDTLRLIHAPRMNVIGPQLSYTEDVQVIDIDRRLSRVEVTPFQRPYFGPDGTVATGPLPFLADAVGVVSGNDGDDFFSANTQDSPVLLGGAFVESVPIRDDPAPYLPFQAETAGSGDPGDSVREVARKWFFDADRPNHQHLLAGSRHADPGLQGVTTARIGTNWSWIFVETVVASSPRRGAAEWRFNGEVTAHELAHQWQVNPPGVGAGGHCDQFRWDSTGLYCSMHPDYGFASTSCRGTCPEFYDGQVGFHYVSANDSEYLTIRRRPEPVPQF